MANTSENVVFRTDAILWIKHRISRPPLIPMRTLSRPAKSNDKFYYVHSCDIREYLQIKVTDLEGVFRDPRDPVRSPTQMIVELTVYSHGTSIGYPVSTSFNAPTTASRPRMTIQSWNEWLMLPVRYCELSRDAFVHITIWEQPDDLSLPPENQDDIETKTETRVSPTQFARRLTAECTFQLFCPKGVLRSGILDLQMELADEPNAHRRPCEPWQFGPDANGSDSDRLIREYEKRREELMADSTWLTQFTVSTMEKIKNDRKRSQRCLFLVVHMPGVYLNDVRYDIVFFETDIRLQQSRRNPNYSALDDRELYLDNPCEIKHSAMTRTTRSTLIDKNLKPSSQTKAMLESIIKLSSTVPLTDKQRDTVYKFRYYLRTNRRALTKFLRSINWEEQTEVDQALQLLNEWVVINAEDALEMLSPTFTHPRVRSYAVSRLLDASPNLLQLFLPQLVQALKYEPTCLTVDCGDVETSTPEDAPDMVEVMETKEATDDLASFLVQYATSYLDFANFLFWHLKVEEQAMQGTHQGDMYRSLRMRLIAALEGGPSIEAQIKAKSLTQQEDFVETLKTLTKKAKNVAGRREAKEMALREAIVKSKLAKLDGLTFPLDPSFRMSHVIPESLSFFNSAMMPLKMTIKSIGHRPQTGEDTYTVLFKQGDDLRQDQLVIQMIRLMDGLLKADQLDLKLTPYAVLATGVDEGFVQFIKARPLRNVTLQYQTIQDAMRDYRPSSSGPYGIEPEVIDNYVRSLAGYSIVCYILGVGDRHLDNLLLCENGKIFHVDFGYILGRDPKPMPPPMKLTTEMIQAMGGVGSKHWQEFRTLCDSAFQILRRHSNVILNLFSLMLDAGIPDIAIEKDKAVAKVEQRLRLDLTDEQAYLFVMRLIETSISAKMPVLMDFVHDVRQNFF